MLSDMISFALYKSTLVMLYFHSHFTDGEINVQWVKYMSRIREQISGLFTGILSLKPSFSFFLIPSNICHKLHLFKEEEKVLLKLPK